jgi:hypothetical protein
MHIRQVVVSALSYFIKDQNAQDVLIDHYLKSLQDNGQEVH